MTKKNVPCWRCRRWKKFIRRQPVHCNMEKPYELLIAVRLSAQCTDARVNQITPKLFAAYPTLESLAAADIGDLEEIVRPCGFYHMKARSIKEMSAQLLLHFGGVVPDNMKDLLSLSGVGRKTANLILGDVYGKPAIVADTHFIRITGRLGLTKSKDPVQVEKDLRPLIPPERSSDFVIGGVVRQRYLPCTKAPVQELSHGGILSLPKRVRASSATVGRGNVAECTENLLENELHFVKIFQNLLTSRVVRAILVIVYFDEKAVSQWAF